MICPNCHRDTMSNRIKTREGVKSEHSICSCTEGEIVTPAQKIRNKNLEKGDGS